MKASDATGQSAGKSSGEKPAAPRRGGTRLRKSSKKSRPSVDEPVKFAKQRGFHGTALLPIGGLFNDQVVRSREEVGNVEIQAELW